MSEHPSFTPSSPIIGLPLKLSAAIITTDRSRARDSGPDHLRQLKLSLSARVLGGIDILLATTTQSGDCAVNSAEEISATERLEMHINSILLSSLPRLIHLSGRSLGEHNDGARAYTLTLSFSDGSAITKSWSTPFEVPRSPLIDSEWHLTVPFNHSLTPASSPCTP